MKILTANEAKTHFGDMILKAQNAPIQINKNGNPVAVILSMEAFEQMETLKLALLKMRTKQAEQSITDGTTIDGEAFLSALAKGEYD